MGQQGRRKQEADRFLYNPFLISYSFSSQFFPTGNHCHLWLSHGMPSFWHTVNFKGILPNYDHCIKLNVAKTNTKLSLQLYISGWMLTWAAMQHCKSYCTWRGLLGYLTEPGGLLHWTWGTDLVGNLTEPGEDASYNTRWAWGRGLEADWRGLIWSQSEKLNLGNKPMREKGKRIKQ